MGRLGTPELLIIIALIAILLIAIPFICYKAGKKRGFEIGKNIGFKEGLNHQNKS